MNNMERSNFELIQEIIEKEQDNEIKNLLRKIKKKTQQAEEQVAMNQKTDYSQCLVSIDAACDDIAHLYMKKILPVYYWEDKNLCKKGKRNPNKNDIWRSEKYIEGWESNEADILLYAELFHLKGESNSAKHSGRDEYNYPDTCYDDDGSLILKRNENNGLVEIKRTPNPVEYSTLENALHRLRNLFDYLCAVLVKCGYLTEEEVPAFTDPKRKVAISEDAVTKLEGAAARISENIQRFEDYAEERIKYQDDYNRQLPNGFDKPDRRIIIIAGAVLMIVVLLGVIILTGISQDKKDSSVSELELEQDIDSHIIMKLSNANHQYEVGLENWKRLDYNRAERDITGAISDITEEKSQAEIDVAKVNNSLGCLYLDMGKYKASYDYLNNAYVTFRDEYGEEDPQTLAILFSIAQYDYFIGDYDSALKIAQQILDNSDIANDKTVSTLIKHFQASIYSSRGDYEAALAVYQDVLKIYREYLKDGKLINELASYTEDPALDESDREKYTNMILWIAKTYENIGETYLRLGRNDEAMDAVSIGLNMCLGNIYIGKKNISTASLYLQKAAVEEAIGNNDDAVDDADLAIRIERNLFDFQDTYPGLVKAYDLYGRVMEKVGDKEEASNYYSSALELSLQSFGENHPNTAEAYYYSGQFAANEKRYHDAEELLFKAIEARKNILGENHPNTVKYYLALAEVESALGKTDEATVYKKNAKQIESSFN